MLAKGARFTFNLSGVAHPPASPSVTPMYLVSIQNRHQKVFNRGALRFCGGLFGFVRGGLTSKIDKNSTDFSVSCFNLGDWSFVWGG